MDRVDEFEAKLEALLKEYGFNLSAGDMGAEIDLQDNSKTLGYWEGSIPGRFVKW
jgi:hypothetical protein